MFELDYRISTWAVLGVKKLQEFIRVEELTISPWLFAGFLQSCSNGSNIELNLGFC